MAVTVTNVPPDMAVIDITITPASKRMMIIGLTIAGVAIAFASGIAVYFFLSNSDSGGCHQACGHRSYAGSGSSMGSIAGPLGACFAARYRIKKITLSPTNIEIERAVAKLSRTVNVSEIESCTIKKRWGGAVVITFKMKDNAKPVVLGTDKALLAALKTELQKRYSFPIIESA